MNTTGSYLDPYPFDDCPCCGGDLNTPDDNLDRYCAHCRHTVKAAHVTWEIKP